MVGELWTPIAAATLIVGAETIWDGGVTQWDASATQWDVQTQPLGSNWNPIDPTAAATGA